jgi:hypothetical protein
VPAYDPAGFDLLGSYKFTASAASSTAIPIEVRELLVIQFNVTGYGGTDIASFRFNGDTGTTYNTSFITWSTAAPTTPTNSLSANMIRTGANGVTNQRSGTLTVYNYSGTAHPCTIQSLTQAAAASAPVISVGGGNWNSAATAQITTVQMLCPGGQTLSTGTSFIVWGQNP